MCLALQPLASSMMSCRLGFIHKLGKRRVKVPRSGGGHDAQPSSFPRPWSRHPVGWCSNRWLASSSESRVSEQEKRRSERETNMKILRTMGKYLWPPNDSGDASVSLRKKRVMASMGLLVVGKIINILSSATKGIPPLGYAIYAAEKKYLEYFVICLS